MDRGRVAGGAWTHHSAKYQRAGALRGAKAELDRELRAVLAHPVELESSPHRPQGRTAHKTGTVSAMSPTEALGYQDLDRFVDQFGAIVAEEFLRLRVHHNNAAFLADDHNAVWRRLDERPVDRVAHRRCMCSHSSPRGTRIPALLNLTTARCAGGR